jgi:putative ABC transport system permease protein
LGIPILTQPPRWGRRLISLLLRRGEHWGLIGDFDEIFSERVAANGPARARVWYWSQIARFAPTYILHSLLWSRDMFKNHMIVAWRNIKKSKTYSALNILGLAVGMAVFILIMLFVRTELSYDRYHANAKNIYRVDQELSVIVNGSSFWAVTPAPLAPALARDIPDVLAAARMSVSRDVPLSIGDNQFLEDSFHWVDPQIFDMFSFPLTRGDRNTGLRDPFSTFLSERTAKRYFGEADPMGRSVVYHDGSRTYEFKVAGVFKDIPPNSHFSMDVVAPLETMAKIRGDDITQWGNYSFYTYVLLKNGAAARDLDVKLTAFFEKHAGGKSRVIKRLFLQPLSRIHLHSRANRELSPPGDDRLILLMASIAFLILIIACINYMNLASACSLKRVKEIGLRKVVGAAKGQIMRQWIGDSMMMTFLALILAVGIVLLALPAFRSFVGRTIVFDPIRDAALTPALILLAALVGLGAGSYPAFFVSSFRPAVTLKGSAGPRSKSRGLRNALIVFQFTASIALIICTLGVRGQLRFIQSADMGYARDQIVVLKNKGELGKSFEAFKTELYRNPGVLKVAGSTGLPNDVGRSAQTVNWPGKPATTSFVIYMLDADYDFADLFGLKIERGRNFSRVFSSDSQGAFLINETAQKAIGWAEAIGREFGQPQHGTGQYGKIVGVLKDFHMHSLRLPIMPFFIRLSPDASSQISIKIDGRNIPETIASIRRTWERFANGYPFEFRFFDEIFDQAYRTEQRMGTMFGVFSGLAVIIACLGLVGLAAFTAERRTKEIGIRKVLGASPSGVIVLLSREFMKWVVLANLIAWPIGYLAMRAWLQNFAYRIMLTPPMFLGAALAAFFFAVAAISIQTYRAAIANPADSIRYE